MQDDDSVVALTWQDAIDGVPEIEVLDIEVLGGAATGLIRDEDF